MHRHPGRDCAHRVRVHRIARRRPLTARQSHLGVCAAENFCGTALHQTRNFVPVSRTTKQKSSTLGPRSGYLSPPNICNSVLRRRLLALGTSHPKSGPLHLAIPQGHPARGAPPRQAPRHFGRGFRSPGTIDASPTLHPSVPGSSSQLHPVTSSFRPIAPSPTSSHLRNVAGPRWARSRAPRTIPMIAGTTAAADTKLASTR